MLMRPQLFMAANEPGEMIVRIRDVWSHRVWYYGVFTLLLKNINLKKLHCCVFGPEKIATD